VYASFETFLCEESLSVSYASDSVSCLCVF